MGDACHDPEFDLAQGSSSDGFNSVIQANYLGHFLLTNLLLNKLKECRPSRILNVSSDLHKGFYFYF